MSSRVGIIPHLKAPTLQESPRGESPSDSDCEYKSPFPWVPTCSPQGALVFPIARAPCHRKQNEALTHSQRSPSTSRSCAPPWVTRVSGWLAGEHETGSPWPRAEFCFKLGISSGTHTASFSCFSGETLKAAELCLVWPSKRPCYWQLLLKPRRGLDLSPQRVVTL